MLYLINLLYNHQGFGFGVFAWARIRFLWSRTRFQYPDPGSESMALEYAESFLKLFINHDYSRLLTNYLSAGSAKSFQTKRLEKYSIFAVLTYILKCVSEYGKDICYLRFEKGVKNIHRSLMDQ